MLLALPVAAFNREKCTPLTLDRIQNDPKTILETVVGRGVSSFCRDANSGRTARMVRRCYD